MIKQTEPLIQALDSVARRQEDYIREHGGEVKPDTAEYKYLVEMIGAAREEEVNCSLTPVLTPDDLDDTEGDVIAACVAFGLVDDTCPGDESATDDTA